MITLPPSNVVVHNLNANGQVASTTSYQFGGRDVYYDINHKLVTFAPGHEPASAPTHTITILYPDGSVKYFASQSANGDSVAMNFEDAGTSSNSYSFGFDSSLLCGQLKDSTEMTGGGKYQTYKEFTNSELTRCRIASFDPDHPFLLDAVADVSRAGGVSDPKLSITLMNKDHVQDPIKIGADIGNFDQLQLISSDSASVISNDGGSLIGHDGASLIGHDGASLIGHDGASVISNDGGSFISRYTQSGVLPQLTDLVGKSAAFILGNVEQKLISSDPASLVSEAGGAFQLNGTLLNPNSNPGISAINANANYLDAFAHATLRFSALPDDAADKSGRHDATLLTIGAVTDELKDNGDGHWYKVSLTAGQTYVFDLKGASSGEGTLSDPWLKLFDANGVLIKDADDGGIGYDSKLVYQAGASGTFYVMARNYNDAGHGTYELDFSKGAAAPQILSNGGGDSATISIPEHVNPSDSDTVTIVSGWDLIDGNTLKYSISGEDAAQFELNPFNGYLSFHATPDFETPRDANHDNVYHVTVTATDADNNTDSQNLTIKVLDVGEPITGTDGDDNLNGGDGDDVIMPLLGHDLVDGKGGNDRLVVDYSSLDAHVVFETQGADNVTLFYVAAGNDGNFGLDFVEYANIEAFTIHGSLTQSNTLTGGAGDDVFFGGRAGDSITGGGGDDVVTVFGGATQDKTGDASIALGDGGSDLLIADYSAATEALTFRYYGHATDSAGLGVDYYSYSDTGVSYGDDLHNRLNYTGVDRFNISGGSAGDNLTAGDGDDTLKGNGGDDTLDSAKGHAVIDGGEGVDLWKADLSLLQSGIFLDFSDPSVSQSLPDGSSIVNIEHVSLIGSKYNDIIKMDADFAAYANTIGTGAGNDIAAIFGGATQAVSGDNTVDLGQGGDDLLIADYSAATEALTFRYYGHSTNSSGLGVDYYSYTDTGVSYGDDLHNRLNYAGVERFNISGGSAGDFLTTGDGADVLKGNGGDDTLDSAKGQANIDGGTGVDLWEADLSLLSKGATLDFSKPSVVQTLADGSSIVNVEHVNITGTGFKDVLTMGAKFAAYANTVNSGDGSDIVTIFGGTTADASGDNTVNLGKGHDAASDDDTLIADYSAATQAITLNIYGNDGKIGNLNANYYSYSDTGISYGDSLHNRLSFSGVEQFDITGGRANDTLSAGDWTDTLSGGGKNDKISGQGGNDILYGDGRGDARSATDGNDMLIGGAGRDQLWGGGGKDLFVFDDNDSMSSAPDIIEDFRHSDHDLIDLSLVDANQTIGEDDAFKIVHSEQQALAHLGSMFIKYHKDAHGHNDGATLEMNTDAKDGFEMAIVLLHVKSLAADDFII